VPAAVHRPGRIEKQVKFLYGTAAVSAEAPRMGQNVPPLNVMFGKAARLPVRRESEDLLVKALPVTDHDREVVCAQKNGCGSFEELPQLFILQS